jgi:hypothetical protein
MRGVNVEDTGGGATTYTPAAGWQGARMPQEVAVNRDQVNIRGNLVVSLSSGQERNALPDGAHIERVLTECPDIEGQLVRMLALRDDTLEMLNVMSQREDEESIRKVWACRRIISALGYDPSDLTPRPNQPDRTKNFEIFSQEPLNIAEAWHNVEFKTMQVKDEAGKTVDQKFMVVRFSDGNARDLTGSRREKAALNPKSDTSIHKNNPPTLEEDIDAALELFDSFRTNGCVKNTPMVLYKALSEEDQRKLDVFLKNNAELRDAFEGRAPLKAGLTVTPERNISEILGLRSLIKDHERITLDSHGWCGTSDVSKDTGPQIAYSSKGLFIAIDGMGTYGNDAPELVGVRHKEPYFTPKDYAIQIVDVAEKLGLFAPDKNICLNGWSFGGEGVRCALVEIMRRIEKHHGKPLTDEYLLALREKNLLPKITVVSEAPAMAETCWFLENAPIEHNRLNGYFYSIFASTAVGAGMLANRILRNSSEKAKTLPLLGKQVSGTLDAAGDAVLKGIIGQVTKRFLLPSRTQRQLVMADVHRDTFVDNRPDMIDRLSKGLVGYEGMTEDDVRQLVLSQIIANTVVMVGAHDTLTNNDVQVKVMEKEGTAGFRPIVITYQDGHGLRVHDHAMAMPRKDLMDLETGYAGEFGHLRSALWTRPNSAIPGESTLKRQEAYDAHEMVEMNKYWPNNPERRGRMQRLYRYLVSSSEARATMYPLYQPSSDEPGFFDKYIDNASHQLALEEEEAHSKSTALRRDSEPSLKERAVGR